MKIEVNISKKYFFGLLIIGLVLIGIIGVVAVPYIVAETGDPSVFGHSLGDIDWSKTVPKNISAVGFCINDDCRTSWPVGNVAKIVAGSGITVTPLTGTGEVTISATGGASQWTASGINIYSTNTGNVGIGVTSPTAKLDVNGGIKGTVISGTSFSSSGTISATGGISGSSISGGSVTGTQICIGASCKSSWGQTTQNCPSGQAIISVNFVTGQATCGSTSRYWTSIGNYYPFSIGGSMYACSALSMPNTLKSINTKSCTGGANCDSYIAGTLCMPSWNAAGSSATCGGSSGTMYTIATYAVYECK